METMHLLRIHLPKEQNDLLDGLINKLWDTYPKKDFNTAIICKHALFLLLEQYADNPNQIIQEFKHGNRK